jgi:hypothetical protein
VYLQLTGETFAGAATPGGNVVAEQTDDHEKPPAATPEGDK